MKELDYQLKVQKDVTKKLNEISKKRKGLTKEKLKEIIKNERNVFLNAIIDLYNQRTDVERRERRLREQLNEANAVIKYYGMGVVTVTGCWGDKPYTRPEETTSFPEKALEYLKKWGVK